MKRNPTDFPYQFLDHPDKLEYDRFPDRDAFYSSLKNDNISDELYSFCQKVWHDHKMSTILFGADR